MSNFEEKKYKQTLINNTPDLWDRIDSNLNDIYTTDSAPDMNMNQINNSSPRIKKHKPLRIYKIAGIIAASIAVIAIPLAIKQAKTDNMYKTTTNQASKLDSNKSFITSNDSLTESEESFNESISTNKGDTTLNEVDENYITDSNDNSQETTLDTITCTITNKSFSNSVGLVYIVKVTDTSIDNISKDSDIYISLRNLSKTELGIDREIGSSLTIKLNDTSYLSTLDNPYFVSAIIKP